MEEENGDRRKRRFFSVLANLFELREFFFSLFVINLFLQIPRKISIKSRGTSPRDNEKIPPGGRMFLFPKCDTRVILRVWSPFQFGRLTIGLCPR